MIVVEFKYKNTDDVKRYVMCEPGGMFYGYRHEGARPIRCDIYMAENSDWGFKEFSKEDKDRFMDFYHSYLAKLMHPIDRTIVIHSNTIKELIKYPVFKNSLS